MATAIPASLVPSFLLAMTDRQDRFAMSYVRAVIAAAGFNHSIPDLDRDSDDIFVKPHLYRPTPSLREGLTIQVKSTYADDFNNDGVMPFSLSKKNHNDLCGAFFNPRILVVVRVPIPKKGDSAHWMTWPSDSTVMSYRGYWHSLMLDAALEDQASKTVYVDRARVFTVETLRDIMDRMVFRGERL